MNTRVDPSGLPPVAVGAGLAVKMEVRHLDFYYDKLQALKNVSMSFYDRRVTAIIGPSGCGKSTLLRVLNRMYTLYPRQRTNGEALLDGVDILGPSQDLYRLRARVGMIAQQPAPFPMSIYENIAYGIRLSETPKRPILNDMVEAALRRADLWDEVKDRLANSAAALSGGQQQRLCIARSLAVKSEVILFDEPCSALDPISTHKIEDLIERLKADYTIVIVTHNMQEAARISDFCAFMYLGEMLEFDTANRIFTSPRDPRTHDYITGRFG